MWQQEKVMTGGDRETVIVIGAGIAGLYVARTLRQRHKVAALVLEASSVPGGKIKTVYDEQGRVKYEAGPWRVPGDHRRVIDLFEELDVTLRSASTEYRSSDRRDRSMPGLSEWDVDALRRRNPLSADHGDLATGFANVHSTASGTLSDMHDNRTQFVTDEGFSCAVDKLAATTRILFDTRVVDIRRNGVDYVVQCRCRESGDLFVNRTYTATTVFVCVPPHCAERWTIISQWARAQLYSVQSIPLHHIYSQTSAPTKFHMYAPTSLLGQGVSSQYNNSWFQSSYTSGRLSRFWHNLRLANPAMFASVLVEEVKRLLHLIIEPNTISSHYNEHAYHAWRPNPHFDIEKAVRSALMPNPKHLPNIFWCGEAFSKHQGWMEGALETAQMAVDLFTRRTAYVFPRRRCHKNEMVVEGRILDIAAWTEVHPGGEGVIKKYMGENATDLFYHIRHSANAWSIIHALQIAVEI